jgi:predicted permease
LGNILLIFLCLGIGMLFQKMAVFPPLSHKIFNQFVIYVSVPAIALYFIPEIVITKSLFFPLGIAWIGFGLSYLFFSSLQRFLGWSDSLTGCLILTSGLGNTAFVGFPIVEAFFKEEGLKTAIVVDQPGSFVVLTTVAVWVATIYSRKTTDLKTVGKKMISFPPFIFFLIGLGMNVLGFHFYDEIKIVLEKLAGTVTPLSLVSVGMQLHFSRQSKHWGFLGIGLLFKLLITPLFFYVFYVLILNGKGLEVQVSLIQSAMPPMISGVLLASMYGLKPKLSNMMVGVGIPISLITLFLWNLLIQTI